MPPLYTLRSSQPCGLAQGLPLRVTVQRYKRKSEPPSDSEKNFVLLKVPTNKMVIAEYLFLCHIRL